MSRRAWSCTARDNLTPLRILFGLLTPAWGGHTRTAVALASALRQRGHAIDFLVGPGTVESGVVTSLIDDGGFRVVRIGSPYDGLTRFRRELRRLVAAGAYDALHWFEMHAGVRSAARVAVDTHRAFVWTVTSGGMPVGYHGLREVVVYTPEVANDVRRRSPMTIPRVLPARVDLQAFDREFVARARRDVRDRLQMRDDQMLVVRVARCAPVYLNSILAALRLVERLVEHGRPAVLLHVGYAEDAGIAATIRHAVDAANDRAGRTIAHSMTEALEAGPYYAAAADVCVASGRSAIEALALERPTLIAWGSRYLGLVDASNVEQIAATNFQGRHSERVASLEAVRDEMVEAVRTDFNTDAARAVRAVCARFVRDHYSVDGAADTYERLYRDQTVVLEPSWRYYGNPKHLGRELFHRLPASLRASRLLSLARRRNWWPGLPRTD